MTVPQYPFGILCTSWSLEKESMMSNALLDAHSAVNLSSVNLEREILEAIDKEEVVSLDALIVLLPQYSWSQIFAAVDGLARCGKVVLRRHRFDYTLFSTNFAA
jgi:hypothetical protein